MIRVRVESLAFRYGIAWVLYDFHATFSTQRVHLIHGGNGVGKSTLLEILALRKRAQQGQVWHGEGEKLQPRGRLGFLGRHLELCLELTVAENLALYHVLVGQGLWPKAMSDLYQDLGVAKLSHKRIDELSSGERQRVTLVRSLAHDPDLLLWDEPTSFLDQDAKHCLEQFMTRWKASKTFVVASHDWQPEDELFDEHLQLGGRREV